MKTYSCLNRTILLAFGYFALLPMARAVNPPPDGCYSQLTTAEGCNALFSLGTGQGNTAIGHDALFSDTTGSWNTSVGAVALGSNNADSNTAVGAAALLLNTNGEKNTGIGAFALVFNNGNANTAVGFQALHNNTEGSLNTANGFHALFSNIDGGSNTATGQTALQANTSGVQNTATGAGALKSNTTSPNNTATGFVALLANTTGADNTANGAGALEANTTGNGNTATGFQALHGNTSGGGNTAIGNRALFNITGESNTALGYQAGMNQTTGSQNVYIGAGVAGLLGENNRVRIADNLPTGAAESACYIGGIHLQDPGFPNNPVLIGFDGKLGITGSSKRFKEHIKPMAKASESILALKPITFHYKSDAKKTPCFGLIAEEVAAVNPDLVVRDKDGEIYSVRYDAVNAMLLNEFLKEHRRVQELETTVAQQQKGMKVLTAQFRQQAAQIQKVSAQLEMRKPAPQLVLRNH